MGCSSCGKGTVLKVERANASSSPGPRIPVVKKTQQSVTTRTVQMKPANDLEKQRA